MPNLAILATGDIITIENVDAPVGARGPWKVGVTEPDGRVRLHPHHEDGSPRDQFNDAAGDFFLTAEGVLFHG